MMDVNELRGHTKPFRLLFGVYSQRSKAFDTKDTIQYGDISAEDVVVRPGYTVPREDNDSFFERGTLEGRLRYSTPVDISAAYQDLVKMSEQTGWDYTHDVRAFFDLDWFRGEWRISPGRSPYKDKSVAEITFQGRLRSVTNDDAKRRLAELVRKTDDPEEMLYGLTMDSSSRGHIPLVHIKKYWPEFDDEEIAMFFSVIDGFIEYQCGSHVLRNAHMLLDVGIPMGETIASARYLHSSFRKNASLRGLSRHYGPHLSVKSERPRLDDRVITHIAPMESLASPHGVTEKDNRNIYDSTGNLVKLP
jgi:hypothetical protein